MKASPRVCWSIGVLLIVTALHVLGAVAADVVVTRRTELRAERYIDAAPIRVLDEGTHVDVIKTEAGWVQVRLNAAGPTAVTGWLRATGLSGDGAARSALALLESGRSGGGNIVAAAGIRRIPKASRLALIIGVESSADGTRAAQRWPGVALDVESARLMAQRFAIPDDNIEVIAGKDATRDGIADALDRLARRTQPGDQVFIYFSGPGSLARSSTGNDCYASWVASDGHALSAPSLALRLKPVLVNADKTMIVSDTAFVVANGGDAVLAGSTRKAVAAAGDERCPVTSGDAAMALADEAIRSGAAASNVVHVQAAPGALQGLDQPLAGGIFTQVVVDCALGDAVDGDGSGSLSIAEIVSCANRWRARAGTNTASRPASILETGPLAMVSGNAGFSPLQGSVATPSTMPFATGVAAISKASAINAIDDVLAQSDGRIGVELSAISPALQIGRDYLDVRIKSSRDGFVYLILLGSDDRSFYLLFPNALDRANRIAAGETLQLPRASWRIQSQGPPGRDVLLAVVAESERDLASLAGEKNGPFTSVLTDTNGRAQLQWLLGRSGIADSQDCLAAGRQRNLTAVKVCSDAFGAARLDIVER